MRWNSVTTLNYRGERERVKEKVAGTNPNRLRFALACRKG
jgi:hypothetical protein